MNESIVTLTWDGIAWANIVAAFVLPILVGLVTKKATPSLIKVLALTVLNTLQSLLGEAIRTWQDGGTYDLGVALQTLVIALLVSWGAYTNVWKPTEVTERAQRVGDKTRPAPLPGDTVLGNASQDPDFGPHGEHPPEGPYGGRPIGSD